MLYVSVCATIINKEDEGHELQREWGRHGKSERRKKDGNDAKLVVLKYEILRKN